MKPPPINTLPAFVSLSSFSPYLLSCHQRGASSVQLQHPLLPPPPLLPSHPCVPSRPIASPSPPSNTPRINTGLIRERGDAEHIARSAGRKEKAVCHCSICLSLFILLSYAPLLFSDSVSNSKQKSKPQKQPLSSFLFLANKILRFLSCVHL